MTVEYSQRFVDSGVDLTIDGREAIHGAEVSWDGTTARAFYRNGLEIGTLVVTPDPEHGLSPLERVDGETYVLVGENGSTWQVYKRDCGCG